MENRPPVTKYIPIISPAKSFIIPGACFECYTILPGDGKLKTCGGCRLVSYCSRNCQKKDWSAHKHFCNFAKAQSETGKNIYSAAKKKIENGEKWFDIVMKTNKLFYDKFGPKFGHIEGKILSVPKVCEFCRCSEPSNLELCKVCCAIYYCSEAHREADVSMHKNLCSTFKQCLECDKFMATKGYPDFLCMPFQSKPATSYEKLPKGILDIINIPSDPIDAIISDWLSYPLTVLYVLEKIGLGIDSSPVQKAKKLSIHVMDSAQALLRLHMSVMWEYLFHRLPNLKKLRVVLIDPDLISDFRCKSDNFQKTPVLCSDCKEKGRKLTINVEGDFKAFKCSDRYERADVILAHGAQNPTDGQCLLPFPEPSIPLILLGVVKEQVEMNLNFLSKFEVDKHKIPIQKNPFCGQRPMKVCKTMRQIEGAGPSSHVDSGTCFVYGNNYICALQRKMKDGHIRHRETPNN